MANLLNVLYWDMKDEIGRFLYLNAILMRIPGNLGKMIRGKIIPGYLKKCGKNVLFNEGIRFRGVHKIEIGDNVHLGVDNFYQASGGLIFEKEAMIGPGVKIWTVNHHYQDIEKPIYQQGYHYESVVIGEGVWIGANAFIMPGVTIPKGCIVSACTLVNKKNYPPFSIIAGHPARVIGTRLKKKENGKEE
ncbi:MAG: acyltransferase [Desulfobacteraceae bacterium]|nr:acyltransferase [Desulfobacteraceae bacterium]